MYYKFILLIFLPKISSQCIDTPNWTDLHKYDCKYYLNKDICRNNDLLGEHYAGASYNFPELNCCACGKPKTNSFYQEPARNANQCTHLAENSVSKHVVDFCAKARNHGDCVEEDPTWRSLHCKWNPNTLGISFGPSSDWI